MKPSVRRLMNYYVPPRPARRDVCPICEGAQLLPGAPQVRGEHSLECPLRIENARLFIEWINKQGMSLPALDCMAAVARAEENPPQRHLVHLLLELLDRLLGQRRAKNQLVPHTSRVPPYLYLDPQNVPDTFGQQCALLDGFDGKQIPRPFSEPPPDVGTGAWSNIFKRRDGTP